MTSALAAILHRRAIRSFEPAAIAEDTRRQLLNAARMAPSSFNIQPYRFYWIESAETKAAVSALCLSQGPATTASALVVAVADIGSWRSTTQSQLEWMRGAGFSDAEVAHHTRRAKVAKWFFAQGWLDTLGLVKWILIRLFGLWRPIGMPPVTHWDLLKWATKNTALACENLMIAAEALGLNTCPMEGFDRLRLSKLLGLSRRHHEVVMIIAVGKKSSSYVEQPQWRRPLETTVTIL